MAPQPYYLYSRPHPAHPGTIHLGLTFANGIPSEDSLERLLKRLNPKELEQTLRACAGSLAGRQLCIDGKEHRATTPTGQRHALVRTVSVWVADAQLSFGQAQIGAKTNEKTAIPSLLKTIDVAGSVVTIDAIACQPRIVAQVVASGADYVIALKKERQNPLRTGQRAPAGPGGPPAGLPQPGQGLRPG